MAYGTNTYADVMAYLHSISITPETMLSLSKQLKFEAQNQHISKVLRRLDQIAALEYDWDGYGGMPVAKEVIANMHSILKSSKDKDWSDWVISPETNGTLCMTTKSQTASVSLGINEFSYYSFSVLGELSGTHIPFTPDAFVKVMRQIS